LVVISNVNLFSVVVQRIHSCKGLFEIVEIVAPLITTPNLLLGYACHFLMRTLHEVPTHDHWEWSIQEPWFQNWFCIILALWWYLVVTFVQMMMTTASIVSRLAL